MQEARTRSCGAQAIVAGALTIGKRGLNLHVLPAFRFAHASSSMFAARCLLAKRAVSNIIASTAAIPTILRYVAVYTISKAHPNCAAYCLSVAQNPRFSNTACARVGTGASLFARSLIITYTHHEKMRLEIDCPRCTQLVFSSCIMYVVNVFQCCVHTTFNFTDIFVADRTPIGRLEPISMSLLNTNTPRIKKESARAWRGRQRDRGSPG